jgi:hypothetical protein
MLGSPGSPQYRRIVPLGYKEKTMDGLHNTSTPKTAAKGNKPPSKKDQLIKLLKAKAGADVVVLSTKLGWLPHSTRAAISGLRKAGYEIAVTKGPKGGAARYRLIDPPEPDQSVKASADGA